MAGTAEKLRSQGNTRSCKLSVPEGLRQGTAEVAVSQAVCPGEEVCFSRVGQCGQQTGVRVKQNLRKQGRAARYCQGQVPKADGRQSEAGTGGIREGQ